MASVVKSKLDTFFNQFKTTQIEKNKVIIHANENPKNIIYLQSGFIRQYIISEDGEELTLHIYKPNSLFPLMFSVSDIPNRYNFQSITDCSIVLAPQKKVIEFLKTDQDVLFDVVTRLLLGLDGLSRRIEIMRFGDAFERVISILIYLAQHFGERNGTSITINYQFTHDQIAMLVGITREHTSIEIERLEKSDHLQYEHHSIVIKDIDKLYSLLETKK